MRYHALAADYDGTLARNGTIEAMTVDALKRLKDSGRRLIMVTGRELEHLLEICPAIDVFDYIVAENGAVIYNPSDKSTRNLAEPPPAEFIDDLRRRGVKDISIGHTIVATWEPHQIAALASIKENGLELQVIFNKGAVMILPSGVNKSSGLQAALGELKLSPRNVVGVGDAENDHAFLSLCECSVAVANALPSLKERCDWTTQRTHGQGVCELIDQMIEEDLKSVEPRLVRHHIAIGNTDSKQIVDFEPYGVNVMICGTSGSGKSTLTTGLLERLVEHGYQFVVMDPEGDYEKLDFVINLGTAKSRVTTNEVLGVLDHPGNCVVVNMLGITLEDRPGYFNELLPHLFQLRSSIGRPHWIIVDEAHHALPDAWEHTDDTLPARVGGALYITVHPESVSRAVLDTIDILIVVGDEPTDTFRRFCDAAEASCPKVPPVDKLEKHDVIVWARSGADALLVHSFKPRSERKRHQRKYAEGNLAPERSFYFRGPEDKLNLRANNLNIFLQMADGVDDETWKFHLQNGDISRWFGNDGVKDDDLAAEAREIEKQEFSAEASRAAIREIIERRYTKATEKTEH